MRKTWTDEEVATLTNAVNGGQTNQEIAETLGRSRNSVEKKIRSITSPNRSKNGNGDKKKLTLALQRETQTKEAVMARLQKMIQTHDTPVSEYFGKKARWGVVSDTHLGSAWERVDLLEKAYKIMHKAGIKLVYHCGDICEGSGMRKGHEYELAVVGADKQVAHAQKVYPYYKDMKTKFIIGTHDLSFFRGAGVNIGPMIADGRDDMEFLGGESVLIPMKIGKTELTVELNHPGGGTAQTISWKVQQYINSLSGGRKPDMLFLGHYHKSEFLPWRNVMAWQVGCLQTQTDWMRRKNLAAVMGFWMIEVHATKVGTGRIGMEWCPFFEM